MPRLQTVHFQVDFYRTNVTVTPRRLRCGGVRAYGHAAAPRAAQLRQPPVGALNIG